MPSASSPKKLNIKCTNCFKNLGVTSRMEIYAYLSQRGSASVGDVVKYIKLTQPTVSYHLKGMQENGLVEGRKQGKEVFYKLTNKCVNYDTDCILGGLKFGK